MRRNRIPSFLLTLAGACLFALFQGCESPSASAPIATDTGSIVDARDGQVYKWVQIGSQKWLARNLNYKTDSSWCYDRLLADCDAYGRLYNWASALGLGQPSNGSPMTYEGASIDTQGACPTGWRVPTRAEWEMLTGKILDSRTSQGQLKATSGWGSGNGTDDFGFAVLPGGEGSGNSFFQLHEAAYFWTATEEGALSARYINFNNRVFVVGTGIDLKITGYSLRCIQATRHDFL